MSDERPGGTRNGTSSDRSEERLPKTSQPEDAVTDQESIRGGTAGLGENDDVWWKRAVTVLQWSIAIGAFLYIAADINWKAAVAELITIPVEIGLGILAVTILEFLTRFSMWNVLLNGRIGSPLADAIRIDLVIKFINHVIPSKASGHSVAPVVVRHYTGAEWSEAVGVAAVNTGLYAVLYGTAALAGVGFFAAQLTEGWLIVVLLSTGLYLAAGLAVLLGGRRLDVVGTFLTPMASLLERLPWIGGRLAAITGAVPTLTDESATAFRDLVSRPAVVLPYAFAWAGTLMIAPGLRVWLLLLGLGETFSPVVLLPFVLIMAYSVTILPLTPGGVGIAEASAAAVFVALGVRPELAAVVVLIDRTLGVYLPSLLGWVPMARLDLASLLASES